MALQLYLVKAPCYFPRYLCEQWGERLPRGGLVRGERDWRRNSLSRLVVVYLSGKRRERGKREAESLELGDRPKVLHDVV